MISENTASVRTVRSQKLLTIEGTEFRLTIFIAFINYEKVFDRLKRIKMWGDKVKDLHSLLVKVSRSPYTEAEIVLRRGRRK
jgi:hypothetical protein